MTIFEQDEYGNTIATQMIWTEDGYVAEEDWDAYEEWKKAQEAKETAEMYFN